MIRLISKLILNAGVLFVFSELFKCVEVAGVKSILLFAIVLVLINAIVKPVIALLSLPITMITFGLFALVVNTWAVMLADWLVKDITIGGFWMSLLLSIAISICNGLFLKKKKKRD